MWLGKEFVSFSCEKEHTVEGGSRGGRVAPMQKTVFIVSHDALALSADSLGFVTSSHAARRDSFSIKSEMSCFLNCV